MTTPTDPFEELDRELREKVGGEFRRTAEEDEFAAMKSAMRARDLSQVAYELLSRGDSVRIMIGTAAIGGTITHARGSLATVTTGEGVEAHINLAGPIVIDVIERSATGGMSREPYGPESFIARLRELELNEAPVEVLMANSDHRPSGKITAVGVDHLLISGASEQFVPLAWVAAVQRL